MLKAIHESLIQTLFCFQHKMRIQELYGSGNIYYFRNICLALVLFKETYIPWWFLLYFFCCLCLNFWSLKWLWFGSCWSSQIRHGSTELGISLILPIHTILFSIFCTNYVYLFYNPKNLTASNICFICKMKRKSVWLQTWQTP